MGRSGSWEAYRAGGGRRSRPRKFGRLLLALVANQTKWSLLMLNAGAVGRFVPGAGVVYADPGRLCQTRTQHVAGFIKEAVLAANQQPHHLRREMATPMARSCAALRRTVTCP